MKGGFLLNRKVLAPSVPLTFVYPGIDFSATLGNFFWEIGVWPPSTKKSQNRWIKLLWSASSWTLLCKSRVPRNRQNVKCLKLYWYSSILFWSFSMLNTKIKCTERNGANTFLTSFSCLPSPNRDFWRGYCPLPMISYLPSLPGKPRFLYLRGWLSAIWKNYRPFLIIGHESLFSGLIMGPGSRGSNLQVGWTKGVSARPENTFRGLRLSGWKK